MHGTTTSTTAPGVAKDKRAFFEELVTSGRFCRDTPLGGILHRGSVSLREISDGDSLHVCIDGADRVSVHVDRFSPVAGGCPDGRCRYSVAAVLAHLVAHVNAQCRRVLRGARGQHRCRLECELVDVPEAVASEAVDTALASARDPECAGTTGSPSPAG